MGCCLSVNLQAHSILPSQRSFHILGHCAMTFRVLVMLLALYSILDCIALKGLAYKILTLDQKDQIQEELLIITQHGN
ncbi:hypothetical protein LEMLEM_LOCUS24492 [Lemmus lemmus]